MALEFTIMQGIHNAEYWRHRSQEVRKLAESLSDEYARDQLLEVAAGYERLAKSVEEDARNRQLR